MEPVNNEPSETATPATWRQAVTPALVIALLALLFTGWQWLDAKRKQTALESALSQKLADFDARSRDTALLAKRAEEASTQAEARIALLQQKQAEFQSQQESLQTLYQEFANNRDERAVAEVEQLLIIANQQLQLAGNVKTALLALQTAEQRLQGLDKPQAVQLREQIAQDIAKLQASPAADIAGISNKLESLAATIPNLPLVSERHPHPAAAPAPKEAGWRGLAAEVWRDIRQLVRIERIDHPEPPLLTPEQAFFLRENLRIRLLTARLALLQRDESTYLADLSAAQDWLKRHFDLNNPAVGDALAVLQAMSGSAINLPLPDISASLGAAARYKLLLQK